LFIYEKAKTNLTTPGSTVITERKIKGFDEDKNFTQGTKKSLAGMWKEDD